MLELEIDCIYDWIDPLVQLRHNAPLLEIPQDERDGAQEPEVIGLKETCV